MKKLDPSWFCIAITFLLIGINSSKFYLVLALSFMVLAFTSKEEE
ncbi:hypothetical protein [Candidatus Enterococcus ferrettii]|uniref:Uncharacterized protein n=1 Tax=Candidatus Enterococcus ferrettii TaxID=2815324 RepID=A0ABV0EU19_9ENTE|nr:hypothetical protein [Enterococcus sp. 665A]